MFLNSYFVLVWFVFWGELFCFCQNTLPGPSMAVFLTLNAASSEC